MSNVSEGELAFTYIGVRRRGRRGGGLDMAVSSLNTMTIELLTAVTEVVAIIAVSFVGVAPPFATVNYDKK